MIIVTNEDNMVMMKRYEDNFFDLAIVDPPYGIDIAKWDKIDMKPNKKYFNELFRVSKNQIIWGGNYFDLPPCKKFIIWDKEIPEGLSFSDCEMAWTSFSGANKIFRYSAYKNKSEKFHPTQKPPQLYKYCLDKYAKPKDKILDTHGGSFSTAIACHDYKFQLTACELDKEYYDKAIQRIKNHVGQTKLF